MQTGSLWCGERCVVPHVARTSFFWERMIGLLGRRALPAGHGLLIVPCGAVHTLGMRFAIDLVFLDGAGHVLCCVAGVKPGRFCVHGGGHRLRQGGSGIGRHILGAGQTNSKQDCGKSIA